LKKIILAVGLLLNISAFAENVHMMEINSDVEGDETAKIALQVNAQKVIGSVLYQNYPNTPYKNFPIENLNKDSETIVKKGPAKIVQIATETINKSSIYFFIHYIYEYNIFGSDKRVKKLKMYYVSPSNLWETMDTDSKKVVTKAFFYVNFINGKQVGINRIETW
jgi:hypothetical protein